MTKANLLRTCPKCKNELKITGGKFCHNCGHQLEAAGDTPYDQPAYIYFQMQDLHQEKNFKNDDEKHKGLNDLKKKRNEWFETCTNEDRIAAMDDAAGVIRHILVSENVDIITLRNITATGKRIGDLSRAYENVAELGGKFYGSTKVLTSTGPDTGEQDISAVGRAGDLSRE